MKEPNNQALRAALEPCPFCKMQPRRNVHGTGRGVVCLGDGMTVGMIHRFQTYGADQDEADAAWNRFAQKPTTDRHAEGRLAGLEELVRRLEVHAIGLAECGRYASGKLSGLTNADAVSYAGLLQEAATAIRAIAKAGQS